MENNKLIVQCQHRFVELAKLTRRVAAFFSVTCFLSVGASLASTTDTAACRFSTYSVHQVGEVGYASVPPVSTFLSRTVEDLLLLAKVDASSKVTQNADIQIYFIVDVGPYRNRAQSLPLTLTALAEIPSQANSIKTLASPWIDLRLSSECKLVVTIMWNLRQLIADQAYLNGVKPVVSGVVTSNQDPPGYLPMLYQSSVIVLGTPKGTKARKSNPSFEDIYKQQEKQRQLVQNEYPPDLFWFFSLIQSTEYHTDTGTFFYQLTRNQRRLESHAADKQAALLQKIAKKFFKSEGSVKSINNVIEADQLFNLADYKILLPERRW